jgi:hypothetical protein
MKQTIHHYIALAMMLLLLIGLVSLLPDTAPQTPTAKTKAGPSLSLNN